MGRAMRLIRSVSWRYSPCFTFVVVLAVTLVLQAAIAGRIRADIAIFAALGATLVALIRQVLVLSRGHRDRSEAR